MLDLFFRKYVWTANLALLFAAAWLLARTVNTLVGATIQPRPQGDALVAAAPPPRPALAATLDSDRLYRLIGVEPPRVEEAGPAAGGPGPRPQTCQDPAARPVKSELRLQVVAGVIGEVARSSLATLLDPVSRETRVLGVGEEFAGARLLGVERAQDPRDALPNAFRVVAIICNGGTKEYLDSDPGSQGPEGGLNVGVAPIPSMMRPGGLGTGVQGIQRLADNRYDIDKQVIEGALTNLNTLATQARLVPSFKNGVANGFKLFQIQPGSLYASIGIENGDVITRINGYEVNSPDKALEVYQKLREASHVTIDLERGGQTIKKDYNIKGP